MSYARRHHLARGLNLMATSGLVGLNSSSEVLHTACCCLGPLLVPLQEGSALHKGLLCSAVEQTLPLLSVYCSSLMTAPILVLVLRWM